jgi:hypothetical protein
MSGVAGGNRIKKQNVQATFNDFENKVLKKIPGYKTASLSGSVKAGTKTDFGDLDIISTFEYDDKKVAKQAIIDAVSKMPDSLIIPFKSERYTGKKYYNSGEIISVLYPIKGEPNETIQVDIMVSLSETEHQFKNSFLDLPAEVQGLILGLVKTALLEQNPAEVFARLGIKNIPALEKNQEYEFNLSSVNLTLRKVTLENFKEVSREEIWKSNNWSDVQNLLKDFDLNQPFEKLLDQVARSLKNPRSKNRVAGIFRSMVSVKSGEVGTPKGDNKEKALSAVAQTLTEAEGTVIGLYGGGFKPPHRGHFYVAKELAKDVNSIKIYIGAKIREGETVTAQQSKEIWEIYAKYLGKPTEIEIAPITPILSVYKEIEANQNNHYVVIASKEDTDRYKALVDNKKGLYDKAKLKLVDTINEEKLSATLIRTDADYLKKGQWMPEELSADDKKAVLGILKATPEYKMAEAIDDVFGSFLGELVVFSELEDTLDAMFDDLDIDINFTKHFKERVIERGLTEEDILDLMSKIHDKYGDALADLPKDSNRVFTHLTKLVDISSAMGSYDYDGLKDLYLTTAYKRKDRSEPEFRTNASSPKLKVAEVTMGTPVAPIAVLPSEERQRMQNLTSYFQKLAPDDVIVDFNGQSIVISPMLYNKARIGGQPDYTPEQEPIKEYQDTAAAINYVPYIASILEYMVRKGMTVMPLPEIKTRQDEENAANIFGNSAYYDPSKKEVVLYVTGRHPKDVLRSFCHEMIHHMQNLEGRLPLITTTNTQEDSALNEIEKEAHYLGSMTMREWEDSVKNEYNDPQDGKAAPYESGYNPVNENALANIIAKLAAPLISLVISRAIDGLFGYIDDIKNIVAPEPYIKFLKGLEKNDEFNKQFIELAIQREKEKNPALGNEWRELTTNLPAFKEAFDKFAEEEGIEGSNKSYLLSKVSITMWNTYLKTWKEIHQVLKKKYPDLAQDLKEGTKYRSIVADVRQAVNIALKTLLDGKKLKGYNVKTKREPSKADEKLAAEYGMSPLGLMLNTEKQVAYIGKFESKSEKGTSTTVEVELKFALSEKVKPGTFYVDGAADSDEGSLEIMLAFNPADGTNMLQTIQPTLTDLIRHETEHLTQSGDQVKPDKWMRKDEARRREIRKNPESWYKYYMLPKEVDANIQGLYTKSKYEKKDFQTVVDAYLDDLVNTEIITVGNKQKIYDLWKARIPQIGGIPNLK